MASCVKPLQIYLIFLCSSIFISCKQERKPDVSKIKVNIKIARFDQDLAEGAGGNTTKTSAALSKKYGVFYDDYIHKMVGDPSRLRPEVLNALYKDKAYKDLTNEVDSVFPNLNSQEKDLTETFKYIKYYYPKAKVPHFIAFVSGFSYQIPIGDKYYGIGLDMFLGKDSKFYRGIVESVPRYLSAQFKPENIVPRVATTYAHEELFPEPDENKTLLSKMVFQGKILYFLEKVLPEHVGDSTLLGYTKKQYDWATHFEGDIWAYMLQNNLLYESDYQKIQVYLAEGPFTPGLGEHRESAPKLGVFTGLQIVKKYMAEHPTVTLQQLMADNDGQKILQQSKYKPKQE
ncbi:gliding motility-associated lipoprotein GldB [Pedobacter sp. UYP30]|uniref:gliding motility lipoprotein GldB n=1 Tax=Pedobacter sp. UYP30 TaxID=1756400 RepID=UPI003391B5E0